MLFYAVPGYPMPLYCRLCHITPRVSTYLFSIRDGPLPRFLDHTHGSSPRIIGRPLSYNQMFRKTAIRGMLFHAVPRYPVSLYSMLSRTTIPRYAAISHAIIFHAFWILIHVMPRYTVISHAIILYAIPCYSILFYDIQCHYIVFYSC